MHLSRKILLVFVIISSAACAAKKATPVLNTADVVTPRPSPEFVTSSSITDPEQGLKSSVDAYKAGRWGDAVSISRQLAEQYPGTPWYKRSLFLAEQALIQMDRPSEADAAMLRVQSEYSELADYAVSPLADYHFAKARYTEAAALYQHMAKRYPESSLTVRSAYRQALALLESYAYAAAAESFEKFLRDNPDSEFCPDAGIGLGRALTAEADIARDVRAYQVVWLR